MNTRNHDILVLQNMICPSNSNKVCSNQIVPQVNYIQAIFASSYVIILNDLRPCVTHGGQIESFILIFHTGSASEMYRIRAHVNQLLKKCLEGNSIWQLRQNTVCKNEIRIMQKVVRVYDVCSQEIYEFIVVGTFFQFKLHLSGVGASTV